MSSALELLNSLATPKHMHDVYDTDVLFEIDPFDKTITSTRGQKSILVQDDHNSEVFTFKIPRYIEGHDMLLCDLVRIPYINSEVDTRNPKFATGVYTSTDLKVYEKDPDYLTFSWEISKNSTVYPGTLAFMVVMLCMEGTRVLYRFGTDAYEDVYVLERIDAELSFENEYIDVIEQWKADVKAEFTAYIDSETQNHADRMQEELSAEFNANMNAFSERVNDNLDVFDEILKTETARMNSDISVLEARMNTFTALGEGSTTSDAELADIRVGVDGTIYPNAGESVRGQITNTTLAIDAQKNRLDCEHIDRVSEIGSEFVLTNIEKNMSFVSFDGEDADVWICNGNYFPMLDNHIDTIGDFASHDVSNGVLTVTTLAGKNYQNVRTLPIFLKAGTYVFHREYEIISGNTVPYEVNSIGFCYISTCTKDGESVSTNIYSIQGIDTDKSVTFDEDVYIRLNIYSNMNAILDYDLTIRFYNFSITKDTYSEYVEHRGENVTGVNGSLAGFENTVVYSDKEVKLTYGKMSGLSYEDIQNAIHTLTEVDNVVVCWGDSLTNGTGNSVSCPEKDSALDNSYPAVLGRLIGDKKIVLNAGVGGEPSWMVATRQGGMSINVEPVTIPADTTAVRVYLKGQEQDYFYDNALGKWTYLEDNLSYNLSVESNSLVNPCYIDGIEGTLTREMLRDGTYAYYFTRTEPGDEHTLIVPKQLITYAYKNLRDAVNIIWVGQNDAPNHNGAYINQGIDRNRVQCMTDILKHKNYIVMDLPSGNNTTRAADVQAFNQQFGSHYLNIRDYIVKYGVAIVNDLGVNVELSVEDQKLIADGAIPGCFRSDSIHGNYWYYQIVARAVYEKGKDLGYWG